MHPEIPVPNPPLSPAEKAVVDSLGEENLAVIDKCILGQCSKHRLKVARIVTDTEKSLADRFPGLSYIYYTLRLQHLVEEGHLDSFGDLCCIRFSEVCLTATRTI